MNNKCTGNVRILEQRRDLDRLDWHQAGSTQRLPYSVFVCVSRDQSSFSHTHNDVVGSHAIVISSEFSNS
jgi:hypothetical protein